ncbi:MAG TPA: redoxin domain-containing protein [Gemmatimonadales bacterium]|jgi:peroxiredoxin|nr:redoxin domain-containing protein [Gemmatimonadales bacterium]
MNTYRDQYVQLFGDKNKVVLLAISVDPDTTLASWAKEKGYHWTFASDSGAAVGRQYGAVVIRPSGAAIDNRTLFVIDRQGKIAHVMAPFREVDPTAYTELGEAIKRVTGPN